jgi:TonB-linked SusC/RagA family outer membrane protein
MKKLSLAVMLVLCSISVMLAQRTVTGKVVDEKGEPLIGVSIFARGTSAGTVTDVDGTYSLKVPEGATTLVFSYTGFTTEDVALGASNTVDLSMREAAEQLSEVVVTGLGIRKEKKALGYGVSTISQADVRLKSESDVGRILRGKATGVDITQTSGLSGSGTNIIIRGYSSITGSNQPLFVVDGVAFNTDTNSDRDFTAGGATASSRFLDLDPNNIAEISILKGLSATVLYGEAGRNGVILVTTKSGNAGANADKKMEITVSQSLSFTEVANLPDYQDSYGNGFSGNFGWFFSNWGPAFTVRGSNGIDANGQIAHPYDQAQYNDDFPEFKGVRYDYRPYPSVENFYQKGTVSNTSFSLDKSIGKEGGISANYSYLSDEGFVSTNTFRKHNLGVGGRVNLLNGLKLKATLNIISSERNAPPAAIGTGSGPAFGGQTSLFSDVLYTPRSIDLINLPYQSPINGSNVYYRRGSAIQNPLWTLNNVRDNENIRRYFSTVELSYELFKGVTALYRIGIDQYAQRQNYEVNKGGVHIPDGFYGTSDRLNTIIDQVANVLYDYDLNENFSIDGVVGVNFRREARDENFSSSTNQFVFDLFTHDNFINSKSFSGKREENTIGAYATASLGFKNWLYLNVQGRNDWTSTLEKDNRSVFYPSASISVVPTDAFAGLQNNDMINYLKLRLGYGTSAGYPDPYQTRNVLSTATNVFLPLGAANPLNTNSVSNRLGNPNLQPEIHKELEMGIEGRFVKNRIGIDVSFYNKNSSDLIINLALDPATGYTNTTVNAAEVYNRGIEAGLTLTPVKGNFQWDINTNLTRNINKVEKVADGVDQVLIAGGVGSAGNYAIPGEWYGAIQGFPFVRYKDANGNELGRLVDADGNYVAGQELSIIGNPNPEYTANLINTFSYKNLALSMHWSYVKGGDIYSFTAGTLLARGNTKDTDFDRFLPLILPGFKEDGTPNDVQGYAGDYFFDNYFFADEGLMFDGTVIRLREISLSYELPKRLLNKTPFGSVFLRVAGENLWYKAPNFPEHVNFDPEVLSLGVGNGRGFDYITGPTAKKYGVSLSVTF